VLARAGGAGPGRRARRRRSQSKNPRSIASPSAERFSIRGAPTRRSSAATGTPRGCTTSSSRSIRRARVGSRRRRAAGRASRVARIRVHFGSPSAPLLLRRDSASEEVMSRVGAKPGEGVDRTHNVLRRASYTDPRRSRCSARSDYQSRARFAARQSTPESDGSWRRTGSARSNATRISIVRSLFRAIGLCRSR